MPYVIIAATAMINPLQLLLGFLLAVIVSILARRARSLNHSGALAAGVLGAVVFGLGGWSWALLLLGFFVSSSALSRLFGRRKRSLNEKFSKGAERDAAQVIANGGFSGLFVLLHLVFPDATWPWVAYAGSLAAVNADTWATELGVLSRVAPRLITTGKLVEHGTSGGISLAGTAAAQGGALFIALLAVIFWAPENTPAIGQALLLLLLVGLAGLLGSLLDSYLGATVQAIYTCPTCLKETEHHPQHTCGSATQRIRGLPWLNNEWVNLACAAAGGAIAIVIQLALGI
ncbi:MAG TPA: DUF92 domain-containing protein [Levilinea sp.]|nr:DUF92 domain-containing protein [Levilinea sp.]